MYVPTYLCAILFHVRAGSSREYIYFMICHPYAYKIDLTIHRTNAYAYSKNKYPLALG